MSPPGPWMVTGDAYRQLVPRNEWSTFVALVKLAPGADAPAVKAAIKKVTDPYYVIDVQNKAEFKGQIASQVNGLLGLLYGLLGLAIIIAILGIINTLALSVVERRREIGMLRAVGMQRAQVRRTIYLESMLIALFGAVLGLALGLTYGSLFARTLRSAVEHDVRIVGLTALPEELSEEAQRAGFDRVFADTTPIEVIVRALAQR